MKFAICASHMGACACAFVGRPKFVVLDEPTVGVDVDIRKGLWQGIKAFAQNGGSVLLTIHYLDEAESVSHRVFVMNEGQIVRSGSVAEIKKIWDLVKLDFTQKTSFDLSKPRVLNILGIYTQ